MRLHCLSRVASQIQGAQKAKSPESDFEAKYLILLVAGVGFEPTTFGL